MSGNWGFVPTGPSPRSGRTRIVLTIASIVVGAVPVVVLRQIGGLATSDITATVVVIVGLLVAGIVFGLRPWSDP